MLKKCVSTIFISTILICNTIQALPVNKKSDQFICKALIAKEFGRSIDIMRASSYSEGITLIEYNRPDDGTLWRNICKIDNNRAIWAAIQNDGTKSWQGRWRDSEFDGKVTFRIENDKLIFTTTYDDGSSEDTEY